MKNIDRREFLKVAGGTALTIGSAGILPGCTGKKKTDIGDSEAAAGAMTCRTNPNTGDKVSILGYGCMRWPMIKDEDGKDIVDQEAVNRLVDHALENGVNYFDAAPVYLQGQCETATGNALSRHPRDTYYIATKLSNHRGVAKKEDGVRMYQNSLKAFRTDYIDYYLLHSISSEG